MDAVPPERMEQDAHRWPRRAAKGALWDLLDDSTAPYSKPDEGQHHNQGQRCLLPR
jgi:hypothetical protein